MCAGEEAGYGVGAEDAVVVWHAVVGVCWAVVAVRISG